MIYDKLENLNRYRGMLKGLDTVIEYASTHGLEALPLGRTDIDDRVYLNHFQYETNTDESICQFESHDHHLDVHIVLNGNERMAIADVEGLEVNSIIKEDDAILYKGEICYCVPVQKGTFVLVYQNEGHVPKLALGASEAVDKIVFKILI